LSVLVALPVQIRAKSRAEYYKSVPPILPVPYAYCLLDLTADDSKTPNKVFKKMPGLISEKISDEIIWQLPCRTNRKGYLVSIDEKNLSAKNLFYRNDSEAYTYIDQQPPVIFNLGINFNLFWTYNKTQFETARKSKSLLQKENQLQLCSTMLNTEHARAFMMVLIRPGLNLKRTDRKTIEELQKKLKDLFFRSQNNYKRFVINSGYEFVNLKEYIIPHIAVEDYDLKHALYVADMILEAADAPQTNNFIGNITLLEELLRIIRNRGEEKSLNDIIGLHTRCEKADSRYSFAKWNIENCYRRLEHYIQDCGKRLEPVYSNALTQAMGHYTTDECKNYVYKIQKAATTYYVKKIWKDFICSEEKYNQKVKDIKEVIDGKPPKDFIDKIVYAYREMDSAGLDKQVGFLEKTSEFLEGLIPQIIKQKPKEIASTLNRINHLISFIENADDISKPVKEVFKVLDGDIVVAIKDASGNMQNFKVKETISKTTPVISRVAKFVSLLNVALALKDAIDKPEFKTCLKTFKEASEAANAFKSVRDQLTKYFGITESVLIKFAGSAIIVLSFMDAADHLKQGNNVALLGDMLIATAGTMQLLTKSGFAGWIAAGVILAGTLIVYFSLDNDEKFLLSFEKTYWSSAKYASDLRLLRKQDVDFDHLDDYLKVRGK
jgi:hypothetical protein